MHLFMLSAGDIGQATFLVVLGCLHHGCDIMTTVVIGHAEPGLDHHPSTGVNYRVIDLTTNLPIHHNAAAGERVPNIFGPRRLQGVLETIWDITEHLLMLLFPGGLFKELSRLLSFQSME